MSQALSDFLVVAETLRARKYDLVAWMRSWNCVMSE
jgi:hypothetical protein